MDRANERGAAGVRLVQAAFHNRSFSLYASLGFDVREPLAFMQGRITERHIPGCAVRPATPADAAACNALSQRLHGFDRGAELAAAIVQGTARVVERGKRITGYTTALAFFRPFHGGDQRGPSGAHRVGRILYRGGNPRAITQQRSVALVPGKRPARCPAHDAHEHRTVQRSGGRVAAVHNVLTQAIACRTDLPVSTTFNVVIESLH